MLKKLRNTIAFILFELLHFKKVREHFYKKNKNVFYNLMYYSDMYEYQEGYLHSILMKEDKNS